MLYVDIPTQQEIRLLNKRRADACVSIYLPTTPLTQHVVASHTALGNLSRQAFGQLEKAGYDKRRLTLMQAHMDDLLDDNEFWRLQANSLAVLLTPDDIRTFRLANRLQESVEVSDRFHLKPLLRAVAYRHTAFVLSISENAVRLIEVSANHEPLSIAVPGLPRNAADAVNKSTLNSRGPVGRIQGDEGQKVRLSQYVRIVDSRLRPLLAGLDVPLILAASEPLASIYRSGNSFPGLLAEGILHTDDRTSDQDLAAAARLVLDGHYAQELEGIRQVFDERSKSGRAYMDTGDVARAATFGAIETLLVDIDVAMPGSIDELSGVVTHSKTANSLHYDIIDEIAGRAISSGAKVLAVRSKDIPGGGPAAAILRYGV
ncbi:MAG: hypothetical protein Q8L53_13925 [Aestuariivirga sp.]|nr:hypothetical protein [Aestuariivirga sp.]